MLCIKQIAALVLLPVVLVVFVYVIPSIIRSYKLSNELFRQRTFHNHVLFRIQRGNAQPSILDHHSDLDLDFEITYPQAILSINDRVDITVTATSANESQLLQMIGCIVIGFESALAYPPNSTERPGMDIIRTDNNQMAGRTSIYWPVEGKYRANYSIEFTDGGNAGNMKTPEIITVYPKSEIAQIISNKVLTDLTIGAYVIGFVGAVKVILDLLTS